MQKLGQTQEEASKVEASLKEKKMDVFSKPESERKEGKSVDSK
ncbi:MAG: hypothetical protein ACKOXB_07580 [Flavobacteriales bacterium]